MCVFFNSCILSNESFFLFLFHGASLCIPIIVLIALIHHIDTGSTTTFLEAAVRAGEISRDYDDIMTAFREAFFAKNAERMDYIEQVNCYEDVHR